MKKILENVKFYYPKLLSLWIFYYRELNQWWNVPILLFTLFHKAVLWCSYDVFTLSLFLQNTLYLTYIFIHACYIFYILIINFSFIFQTFKRIKNWRTSVDYVIRLKNNICRINLVTYWKLDNNGPKMYWVLILNVILSLED